MNITKKKKILLSIILMLAFASIVAGAFKVWDSFKKFEGTIIAEKDSQIRKRIILEDANLTTTIENFIRETQNLNEKTIEANPIYAGTLVYQNGEMIEGLSNCENCTFSKLPESRNFVIATNEDDQTFIAYRTEKMGGMYYYLVSLENLLNEVVGTEQDSEEMNFLMVRSGKVTVYKEGETISVIHKDEKIEDNIDKCVSFMNTCLEDSKEKTKSIGMEDMDKNEYTARIVVLTPEENDNEIFAIGKTSNFDATIKPSITAANRILRYSILILIGISIIVFIFLSLQKSAALELHDVRARNKILEEINQKMQALSHHQRLETIGTMTAGIAHDFNNLLTPIMGYSMMTMEKLPKDDEELQENLLEIYNASTKAKEMISRLAELSRRGDVSEYEPLNIDEIIRNAIKVSYPVKPEAVNVVENLNAGMALIKGDKTQLSQMILNFTLNAYDALSKNGGTYTIKTMQDGDNVEVQFIDDGPGMDAETVAKIFDPFFTTKESGKGTGLGLAIIAQIAETHNAKIYVNSELGTGTEFKVVFHREN